MKNKQITVQPDKTVEKQIIEQPNDKKFHDKKDVGKRIDNNFGVKSYTLGYTNCNKCTFIDDNAELY